MKSTKEVANMLGISIRQVNNHAKNIGVVKIGSGYVFSDRQIEKIRARMGKIGRPKKLAN